MNDKFTPGPWQIVGATIYALQPCGWKKGVEQFENRFSAQVQGYKCPQEEILASARLIAASPDLLEACRRLVHCMYLANWEGDDATLFAITAIAKATGAAE